MWCDAIKPNRKIVWQHTQCMLTNSLQIIIARCSKRFTISNRLNWICTFYHFCIHANMYCTLYVVRITRNAAIIIKLVVISRDGISIANKFDLSLSCSQYENGWYDENGDFLSYAWRMAIFQFVSFVSIWNYERSGFWYSY